MMEEEEEEDLTAGHSHRPPLLVPVGGGSSGEEEEDDDDDKQQQQQQQQHDGASPCVAAAAAAAGGKDTRDETCTRATTNAPPHADLPPPENRIDVHKISNSSNADLLLLRRCQRDASLLMARRLRATAAAHEAAAAPTSSAAPREGWGHDPHDDIINNGGGAEAKEASRHSGRRPHPILYIDTAKPPHGPSAASLEEQYHYVVTTAAMPAAGDFDDGFNRQQLDGGSILSSLKDSYADERTGEGFDGVSLGTSASGPVGSQNKAQQRRMWRGGGTSSGSSRRRNDSLDAEECAGGGDWSDVEMDGSRHRRGGGSRDARPDHKQDNGTEQHNEDMDEEEEEDDDNDDDGCTFSGAPDSDYSTYHVKVNPDQMDRAVDIPLYSAARPHMRAFHVSWIAFFVAFLVWFSISPLLGEIAATLHLTHEQIWTSSCLAVASSAVTRIVVGPLNDMFGARYVMAATLVAAAIPTALAGAVVNGPASLYVVRFFVGIAGSAFVTCQYWTSCMFTVEIAGTANALVRVSKKRRTRRPLPKSCRFDLFPHPLSVLPTRGRLPGGGILAEESVRTLRSIDKCVAVFHLSKMRISRATLALRHSPNSGGVAPVPSLQDHVRGVGVLVPRRRRGRVLPRRIGRRQQ
jgi:Major Facilitator Superfamily